MIAKFERVITIFWIGGIWTIGYVVAPVLFKTLPKVQAGEVAGVLFSVIGYVGLIVAVLLGWRAWRARQRLLAGLLGGMWVCITLGLFVLQPMMSQLKAQGLVPESAAAHQFGMMHGISSALYLLTSVLALVYVIMRKEGISRD